MNDIFKKIIIFLFWVFIFVLLVCNGSNYLDPDFGWHLRVGQDISINKEAPSIEYYDYTLEGQKWVDHEWAFNYLTYIIFDNYGYFSLIIFFAFIAFLTFYLLYRFILHKFKFYFDNNFLLKVLLLLFIVLGVHASLPHLGVRMQEITVLNIVLLLIILDIFSTKKNIKILFFLPILFVFWANFHAGFLIGLFLLGLYMGLKLFESLSYKYRKIAFLEYKNILNHKELSFFFLFSLLSFSATLLNPYGINLYSFLGSYSNDFYLKNISEWLPFYYLPIQYKQIFYDIFALTPVFIVTYFYFKKIKNQNNQYFTFPIWEISLFVLFAYLALKSKRHFPLFFVASLPFVFSICIELFNESFLFIKKKINLRILALIVIPVLIILSANQVLKTNLVKNPFDSFCKSYPCSAVAYLIENPHLQTKRVLNEYSWGGYLIWTLPEMKLFIDGRLPQFEYNGQSMLEEYRDFFVKENIETKLNDQNIEMVFVKTKIDYVKLNWFEQYFLLMDEKLINTRENNFVNYLNDSLLWEEVYADDISAIYVKI